MTPCLEWTGHLNAGGYGRTRWNGKLMLAHRMAWEEVRGPIPTGMQIDHLCRNRACVNVDHLEIVTLAENVRRGLAGHHNKARALRSHCPHGHEFAAGNEYITPKGVRDCRACRTEAGRRARAKRRNSL